MKSLTLDIGNSTIKAGFWVQDALIRVDVCQDLRHVKKLINEEKPGRCIIATVRKKNYRFINYLKSACGHVILLDHHTPVPVSNLYKTPETLGTDRLAGVVGAEALYPNRDLLVIDAGSCITYDFIDKHKIYHGGAISPGITMRFKALHNYTDRLPLVNHDRLTDVTGHDTRTSIQSGVINGILFEAEGFIHYYRNKHPDLQVVVTGGYCKLFESHFKTQIFAVPNLVLQGLYEILKFNSP